MDRARIHLIQSRIVQSRRRSEFLRDDIVRARGEVLRAKDTRKCLVLDLVPLQPGSNGEHLLFFALNIPGPLKERPGIQTLFRRSFDAVRSSFPECIPAASGRDRLGPYAAVLLEGDPAATKREAIRIEESLPWGRLLDLNVFKPGGTPVDRTELGVEPRRCLACGAPARDCIALKRHDRITLVEATDALIRLAAAC